MSLEGRQPTHQALGVDEEPEPLEELALAEGDGAVLEPAELDLASDALLVLFDAEDSAEDD